MRSNINDDKLKEIEELENKYLKKYYHFLKFCEDEILIGLETKNEIKNDWIKQWRRDLKEEEKKKVSDFSVGAERIIYSLINGKGIGQPNSSPIGSDLFFEVQDAYIHIDLKTVQIANMGDFINNVVVGNNQNSYKTNYGVDFNGKKYDLASLPYFYRSMATGDEKPCLTYFISILYEAEELDIIAINLISMPNGALVEKYQGEIINAGKNQYDKKHGRNGKYLKSIRYAWYKAPKFKMLNKQMRYIPIYYNEELIEKLYNSKKLDKLQTSKLLDRLGKYYKET